MTRKIKAPTLLDALIPVLFLVSLLTLSVYLYGDDSSYGANQIALILAAGLAAIIGIKNGHGWKVIEAGIVTGISTALGAILILLAVGSLIGTWILAGTVPTMIYYGLQIMHPSFFYVSACLICILVSVSIGSSWTTAGTIGVALIGISQGLGLSLEMTAGAILSRAPILATRCRPCQIPPTWRRQWQALNCSLIYGIWFGPRRPVLSLPCCCI